MEDIEQHGGMGGTTFFSFSEPSTDIMKTENDNTVVISEYMFYLPFFFQGVVEGVVIEVANVDVRHPQQGRLKFLLSCHLYIKKSSVLKFSLQFC